MSREEKLQDLVNGVRKFAEKNPRSDTSDYIRQVTEKIDDLYDGMMSTDDNTFVLAMLRRVAAFGKYNDKASIDLNVIATTEHIKHRLQGGIDMKKQDLNSMVFRRVSAAITTAVHGLSGITNQRISEVAEEYAAKITEDVFGGGVVVGQFSEYVDKFYEMDPATEDVLDNGTLVIDGMKVLLEPPSLRRTIKDDMTPSDISDARVKNRWATVTQSRSEPDLRNGTLSFIAVYDDGTKRKVVQQNFIAWIVKKDSIPRIDFIFAEEEVNSIYAGPTVKIVEALKGMRPEVMRTMRVQTGKDGDIVPAVKYLQDLGEMAIGPDDYEVVDSAGSIIYGESIVSSGNKDEVVKWLAGKFRSQLEDLAVGRKDEDTLTPALNFLKNNGVEVDDEPEVKVLSGSTGVVFSGTTEEAVKWLRDRSAVESYNVYLGEGFDTRVEVFDFLANNIDVAVDYKHYQDEVLDGNNESVFRSGKIDRMIEFLKALTPEQKVAYKVRQAGLPQCYPVYVYLDMVMSGDDE